MKKVLVVVSCALLVLTSLCSCHTNRQLVKYTMNYIVESPANKKEPFGLVNTTKIGDPEFSSDEMVFHYEDSIISIYWGLLERAYHFSIENKTNHTIKINWDDVVYVNSNGTSGKVIHGESYLTDFKNTDPYNRQVPSSILRGMKYEDYLIPVNNFHKDDDEWELEEEFHRYVRPWNKDKIAKQKGTTTLIQIPVVVENIQNDYVFSFQVNDIDTSEQERVFSKGKTTGLSVGLGVGSGVLVLLLVLLL